MSATKDRVVCYRYILGIGTYDIDKVEPPNKGHFGNNINLAVLSLVEKLSSSRRFTKNGNYREDNILGLEAVSLVERSVTYSVPFLESPLSEALLYI